MDNTIFQALHQDVNEPEDNTLIDKSKLNDHAKSLYIKQKVDDLLANIKNNLPSNQTVTDQIIQRIVTEQYQGENVDKFPDKEIFIKTIELALKISYPLFEQIALDDGFTPISGSFHTFLDEQKNAYDAVTEDNYSIFNILEDGSIFVFGPGSFKYHGLCLYSKFIFGYLPMKNEYASIPSINDSNLEIQGHLNISIHNQHINEKIYHLFVKKFDSLNSTLITFQIASLFDTLTTAREAIKTFSLINY